MPTLLCAGYSVKLILTTFSSVIRTYQHCIVYNQTCSFVTAFSFNNFCLIPIFMLSLLLVVSCSSLKVDQCLRLAFSWCNRHCTTGNLLLRHLLKLLHRFVLLLGDSYINTNKTTTLTLRNVLWHQIGCKIKATCQTHTSWIISIKRIYSLHQGSAHIVLGQYFSYFFLYMSSAFTNFTKAQEAFLFLLILSLIF